MPFCAAAAIVKGRVGIDTFEPSQLADPAILAMQERITMRVDPTLDAAAPSLTQSHVAVWLRDGKIGLFFLASITRLTSSYRIR